MIVLPSVLGASGALFIGLYVLTGMTIIETSQKIRTVKRPVRRG